MGDMDRAADDQLVGEAAPYLEEGAPSTGGRNTRPLAIPVLVTTYTGSTRTGAGAAAALLGALAGLGAWFGFEQLDQPDPSTVLAVLAFVVAAGALAASVLLGIRLLRSGARLVEALRRWHQVAPEVPVRGAEVLTEQPGILRVVLAGVSVLAGLGTLLLAALTGETSVWVGGGIAAVALLATGAVAGLGWWKLRSMLRLTAPQASQEAFAPAPYAHPGAPQQPYPPAQPQHPLPQASPQAWAPPPPQPAQPPQPQPTQPWLPGAGAPGGETWQPEVSEPDIGDTRLVADTTMSGRSERAPRPAVVLDDGRRLTSGAITLLGRAPLAKEADLDVETVAVLHPTVSKTHASFRITADTVYVTDRSSTNGSSVVDRDGAQRRLRPWVEEAVETGSEVLLGSYRVTVVAAEDMP
jgi:hypothetical protein